jgi:integrase
MIETAFANLLDLSLTDIDGVLIDRWWRDKLLADSTRTKRPVSKATLSRHVAALRAAMSKACDWKLLETNPLLGLKNKTVESRKVIRYLSPDEESRLRAALKARDHAGIAARVSGNAWRMARNKPLLPSLPDQGYMDHLTPVVLLAINTGLRRAELLSLRWSGLDMHAKMLTVRAERAKNGHQRHVPLNTEALTVLSAWRDQSADVGTVFTPADIKTAWVNLLVKAKITNFRFHDLRHHFASRLVTKGVDLNTVRELLGHADIKMTLRYAHLGPDHLAAAVARLD